MRYNIELSRQRWVVLLIYIFFNVYYSIIFSFRGTLGGDFKNEYPSEPLSLSLSLLLVLITLFIFCIIYEKLQILETNSCSPPKTKIFDLTFLLIAIVYFYGSINGYYLSFNSDGEQVNRPFFFSLFSFLIHPDYLLLIYLFYRLTSVSVIYLAILVITLVSFFIGGRTLILIFMLPLINIYLIVVKHRQFNLKANIKIVLIAIACYPFLRATKWIIPLLFIDDGVGFSDIYDVYTVNFLNGDFIQNYLSSLDGALERFQHVANISFLIGNEKIINYIDGFDYRFLGGVTGYFINKLSGAGEFNLNNIYASAIDGRFNWETHTGFAGLFLIDTSVFIQSLFAIFIFLPFTVILSKRIDGDGVLRELNWLCLIVYMFHGWVTAFVIHFEALFVFLVLVRLFHTRLRH